MKRFLLPVTAVLFTILCIVMIIQRPNEEQFYIWLDKKHQISCENHLTCVKKQERESLTTMIETGSYIKNGYLIFNTIGKTFEDQNGKEIKIKAIGAFGHYFTIVNDETSIDV